MFSAAYSSGRSTDAIPINCRPPNTNCTVDDQHAATFAPAFIQLETVKQDLPTELIGVICAVTLHNQTPANAVDKHPQLFLRIDRLASQRHCLSDRR
jgi:hypothetical protein